MWSDGILDVVKYLRGGLWSTILSPQVMNLCPVRRGDVPSTTLYVHAKPGTRIQLSNGNGAFFFFCNDQQNASALIKN